MSYLLIILFIHSHCEIFQQFRLLLPPWMLTTLQLDFVNNNLGNIDTSDYAFPTTHCVSKARDRPNRPMHSYPALAKTTRSTNFVPKQLLSILISIHHSSLQHTSTWSERRMRWDGICQRDDVATAGRVEPTPTGLPGTRPTQLAPGAVIPSPTTSCTLLDGFPLGKDHT
jgi:hypothetical protein